MDQQIQIKMILENKLSELAKKWEEERYSCDELFNDLEKENSDFRTEVGELSAKLKASQERFRESDTERVSLSEELKNKKVEHEIVVESQKKEIERIKMKLEEKLSFLAKKMEEEQKSWEERISDLQNRNGELKGRIKNKDEEIISAMRDKEIEERKRMKNKMNQALKEIEMSIEGRIDEFRRKMEIGSISSIRNKSSRSKEYESWKTRRDKI